MNEISEKNIRAFVGARTYPLTKERIDRKIERDVWIEFPIHSLKEALRMYHELLEKPEEEWYE